MAHGTVRGRMHEMNPKDPTILLRVLLRIHAHSVSAGNGADDSEYSPSRISTQWPRELRIRFSSAA